MPLTKFKLSSISDGGITNAKLADDAVNTDELADNIEIAGTEATKLPVGTTAQRTSAKTGDIRFNSTTSLLEYYNGSTWVSIDTPPTVSSISPDNFDSAGDTITISGSFFGTGATVKVINANGVEYTPSSVSVVSGSQITFDITSDIVTDGQTSGNDLYDIKVTNQSGLSNTLEDCLDYAPDPVFATSTGTIGTIYGGTTQSSYSLDVVTATSTDPDDTITYSYTGSLPSGMSLNTSTGALSGTVTVPSSSTDYSFTVTATATGESGTKTSSRAFSITVSPYTVPTPISSAVVFAEANAQDRGFMVYGDSYSKTSVSDFGSNLGSDQDDILACALGDTWAVTIGHNSTGVMNVHKRTSDSTYTTTWQGSWNASIATLAPFSDDVFVAGYGMNNSYMGGYKIASDGTRTAGSDINVNIPYQNGEGRAWRMIRIPGTNTVAYFVLTGSDGSKIYYGTFDVDPSNGNASNASSVSSFQPPNRNYGSHPILEVGIGSGTTLVMYTHSGDSYMDCYTVDVSNPSSISITNIGNRSHTCPTSVSGWNSNSNTNNFGVAVGNMQMVALYSNNDLALLDFSGGSVSEPASWGSGNWNLGTGNHVCIGHYSPTEVLVSSDDGGTSLITEVIDFSSNTFTRTDTATTSIGNDGRHGNIICWNNGYIY